MGIVIACDTMRPSSRPMLHSYQGAEGDHVSYDWPVERQTRPGCCRPRHQGSHGHQGPRCANCHAMPFLIPFLKRVPAGSTVWTERSRLEFHGQLDCQEAAGRFGGVLVPCARHLTPRIVRSLASSGAERCTNTSPRRCCIICLRHVLNRWRVRAVQHVRSCPPPPRPADSGSTT